MPAAVEEKPLQQIPMPNQILNSNTDKAVRPLTGDILKDITHTSDSIVDEPVAAQTAESTGPATDVSALGKADGPAASKRRHRPPRYRKRSSVHRGPGTNKW